MMQASTESGMWKDMCEKTSFWQRCLGDVPLTEKKKYHSAMSKRLLLFVGSSLMLEGIEELRKLQCQCIIVLGHHEYYLRFGFEKASLFGITCQWDGMPDEAFMILWLDKSKARQVSGLAKYREEFNEAL